MIPPDCTCWCTGPACDCGNCPDGYYSRYTIVIPAGTVTNNIPQCDCSVYNGTLPFTYIGDCIYASTAVSTDASCGVTVGAPLYHFTPGGGGPSADLVSQQTFPKSNSGELEVARTIFITLSAGPEAGICKVTAVPPVVITATPDPTSFVPCPPPMAAKIRALMASQPASLKLNREEPCQFRGPELTGPERQALFDAGQKHITHNRRFAFCTKPGFELEGRAVCPCAIEGQPRCGVGCSGYVAKGSP